jgi:hypothetical protein
LRRKGPLAFTSNGFWEGRDLWLSHPMGFEKEGSSGFHIQWVLRMHLRFSHLLKSSLPSAYQRLYHSRKLCLVARGPSMSSSQVDTEK